MPGRNDFAGDPEPSTGGPRGTPASGWNAQTTQLSMPGWPARPEADAWPGQPETGGWPARPEAAGRPARPEAGGWPDRPEAGVWPAPPEESRAAGRSPGPDTGGWSAAPGTGGWSAQPDPGAWSGPAQTGGWPGPAQTGGWSAPPANAPGPVAPPAGGHGSVAPGHPPQPPPPGPVTQMLAAALPDTETMPRSRQRALARARARQRRRRILILGALLVAVTLIGADLVVGRHLGGAGHRAAPAARGTPSGAPPSAGPSVAVPRSGPGTFAYAAGTGPVVGAKGSLHQYRVAVENGTGQDPAAFADATQQTLADPRGWIAGGDVRFQRVAQNASAGFTVYLATPATSERMCAQGGVHTQQLISCVLPGQVIINLARWLNGIPGYGAPLTTYQQFTINHEVGRALGHGDEGCPAPGVLAPVMQEQTLGLKGCVANAWPYVNGKRYTGPAVP